MSSRGQYVSLTELSETEAGPVAWQASLPDYAPADAIGIHVRRLGKLARLGGMSNLKITSYRGEITQVEPTINSVLDDGTATAGVKAAIKEAQVQKNTLMSEDSPYGPYDYIWPEGVISLNVAEIDNRVGEEGKLRDPKTWSKEIDQALRKGIRDATHTNLYENPKGVNRVNAIGLLALFTGLNYAFGERSLTPLVESDAENFLVWSFLVDPLWEKFLNGRSFRERRLSFVPGIQLDRITAVEGLTRLLPVAKQLK